MALPGLTLLQKYRGEISKIAGLVSLCLLAISDHSWPPSGSPFTIPFVIRSEESYLTARFGGIYLEYKAATPGFILRLGLLKKSTPTWYTPKFSRDP